MFTIRHTYTIRWAEAIADSPKAVLIDVPGADDEWIPRSRIHADSEVQNAGDKGALIICEWLARKIGWC